MHIAVSSWSYRSWFDQGKCDFFGFLDEVERQGAEGFEIFPRHIDRSDTAGALYAIKQQADERGLGISSLICGNDFAYPIIAERAEHVANMIRDIREATAAGITRLNVFTGYHRDGQDPEMETARVIDCYREVMPVAQECGATLCIENHSSVHPDADGILWIIRAVGSPNLKTNPDPTNFVRNFTLLEQAQREPIYTETAKIAPLAANAHLKIRDFDPDGNAMHVDVPRVLDIFREAGYDGWIALEYYGRDDPAGSCEKGVKQLKRLLK